MRNLSVCLAVVALAACGPSSKEMATVKSAHYKGDKLVLFNAAKAAVQTKYNLDKSDENTLGFQTVGRWYNPEGQLAMEGNTQKSGAGYNSMYPDNSVNLVLVVTMLPDGDSWVVKVKPVMNRYHAGASQLEPLAEDDISVPGWAHGRVDAIAVDIHDALKQYEVKSLPGAAPPPTEPAPAAPAAPAPAAPPPAAQ